MTTTRLTDSNRVEISGLEEHVLRVFRHTALQATEHTSKTHRFLAVGDHQVSRIHLALHAIQGHKLLALTCITHMDLVIFYFIGIESMQRLTALVQHEVRYVHDIIDRTQTNRQQTVLQPFRTLLNGHSLDAHARIPRTCIRRINYHLDR